MTPGGLMRHFTSQKPGLPPGSVVHVGEKKVGEVRLSVIEYSPDLVEEREVTAARECLPREGAVVTWVNVTGLHDVPVIESLGEAFGLHPLTLEDVANTYQQPKYEDFDEYLFLALKMVYHDSGGALVTEQVSLVAAESYVISFQETGQDVFEPVRERIRKERGRIRRMGADYLAYALLDAVIDNYFLVMGRLGDGLEDLEAELLGDPRAETLQKVHAMKREIIFLRKSVWPLREIIGGLQRGESPILSEETKAFLRDLYDHTIQVIDGVETYRDLVSGLQDLYLSSVSNRMNEVMKVLTIIATIFIPLTFVAGIYGMNFERMPELGWTWGYPAVLGVMAGIGLAMYLFFRRKGWL